MQEYYLELWVPSLIMVALFVRQAMFFSSRNLMNFSPIIISIAISGSVLHLMLFPILGIEQFFTRFQTALIPIFVGLLLFLMSNIMYQAKEKMDKNDVQELSEVLVRLIGDIKEYFSQLDVGLHSLAEKTSDASRELEQNFREEFGVLRQLKENQVIFLQKFEHLSQQQSRAIETLEHYTKEQSVELDNVLHKHLDLLRLSEQDHYNILYKLIRDHIEEISDKTLVEQQLISLQEQTEKLSSLLEMSANTIVQNTQSFFDDWFDDFKSRFEIMQRSLVSVAQGTKSYENAIATNQKALYTLEDSIIGASKHMNALQQKTVELEPIYDSMNNTAFKLLTVAGDYEGVEKKFEQLLGELSHTQEVELRKMYSQVDKIAILGVEHIKESLNLLHEHYGINTQSINEKIQAVSKKGILENTYGLNDDSGMLT